MKKYGEMEGEMEVQSSNFSITTKSSFFFKFLGVRWDWVHLARQPLTGLLYQPRMIDDECGAVGGMRIDRGNQSTGRKPAPVPLCPPQIPHDLTRARTRATAVGSRRLTDWAMVRSTTKSNFYFFFFYFSHGVRLIPLGTAATVWPMVPAPDDRWGWWWSNRWNANWQGKLKYSNKTCPTATLFTTNPIWLY
jgi:hypothetical protein